MAHHEIIIVGGGSAGISVAARLAEQRPELDVAIIEPNDKHYYQPIWTLVGGGVFDKKVSERDEADLIPPDATWIRDAAVGFEPQENRVQTKSGEEHTYDYLVVAAGIQLDWDKVKGLEGNVGKNGICSNYSYDTVTSTWENFKNFESGNAVFTFPSTPIKCAGAPQKIMWLADHYFRKHGKRERANIIYASATAGIFGVPKYQRALDKLVAERDIETHYNRNLIEVKPDQKVAVFEDLNGGEPIELEYEMLHVVPPQSAPDFIKESPLSNDEGWVHVDKYTTQHVHYPNVFSLGDASSLPTSRTGAAVRKEVPVTVANLLAVIDGREPKAKYDGYASCPLVTGYGRLILAEFGYDGEVMETFPFDQAQERYSMYALKAYGLPEMYWHGMLRGRM